MFYSNNQMRNNFQNNLLKYKYPEVNNNIQFYTRKILGIYMKSSFLSDIPPHTVIHLTVSL